jgi:hypothetical protein
MSKILYTCCSNVSLVIFVQNIGTITLLKNNNFRLTSILVPVAFGIILTIGLVGNILVIAVVSITFISTSVFCPRCAPPSSKPQLHAKCAAARPPTAHRQEQIL